jgi:hypothetical protein
MAFANSTGTAQRLAPVPVSIVEVREFFQLRKSIRQLQESRSASSASATGASNPGVPAVVPPRERELRWLESRVLRYSQLMTTDTATAKPVSVAQCRNTVLAVTTVFGQKPAASASKSAFDGSAQVVMPVGVDLSAIAAQVPPVALASRDVIQLCNHACTTPVMVYLCLQNMHLHNRIPVLPEETCTAVCTLMNHLCGAEVAALTQARAALADSHSAVTAVSANTTSKLSSSIANAAGGGTRTSHAELADMTAASAAMKSTSESAAATGRGSAVSNPASKTNSKRGPQTAEALPSAPHMSSPTEDVTNSGATGKKTDATGPLTSTASRSAAKGSRAQAADTSAPASIAASASQTGAKRRR